MSGLRVRVDYINGSKKRPVLVNDVGGGRITYLDEDAHHMGRIVTCVNACAGMADPVAEIARLRAEDHPGPDEKALVLARLTAERDDLLALIEAARFIPDREHPADDRGPCLCGQCAFVRARRAAIAKVRS